MTARNTGDEASARIASPADVEVPFNATSVGAPCGRGWRCRRQPNCREDAGGSSKDIRDRAPGGRPLQRNLPMAPLEEPARLDFRAKTTSLRMTKRAAFGTTTVVRSRHHLQLLNARLVGREEAILVALALAALLNPSGFLLLQFDLLIRIQSLQQHCVEIG